VEPCQKGFFWGKIYGKIAFSVLFGMNGKPPGCYAILHHICGEMLAQKVLWEQRKMFNEKNHSCLLARDCILGEIGVIPVLCASRDCIEWH
jgi:hypothetical protein